MTDSPTIQITEEDLQFPLEDILTGRGMLVGKSDSGKSNTVGIILEKILEEELPFLIVDTEGEHYALKEEYEVLHVGADEECDLVIGEEHAGKIAELALEKNIPIVLDVSGYLDEEEQERIIDAVIKELFHREKKARKPFLVLIEEAHEFVPEEGKTECSEVIKKVAKRGRKRGLGLCVVSQRPAVLETNVITQANWRGWHKLDWNNDLELVRKVLEKNKPREDIVDEEDPDNWRQVISSLEPGEAVLEADFMDFEAKQVKFLRKKTFDAGATPTLKDVDKPDLKSVSGDLVKELEKISKKKKKEKDRMQQLEERIEDLKDDKEKLEDELEMEKRNTETVDRLAEKIARIGSGDVEGSEALEEIKEEKNQRIRELEKEKEKYEESVEELESRVEELSELEEYKEKAEKWEKNEETLREALERMQEALGLETDTSSEVQKLKDKLGKKQDIIERLKKQDPEGQDFYYDDNMEFAQDDLVQSAVQRAAENTTLKEDHHWDVVTYLVKNDDGEENITQSNIVPMVDVGGKSVSKILKKLEEEQVVKTGKTMSSGAKTYHLNKDGMSDIKEQKKMREDLKKFRDEVKPE